MRNHFFHPGGSFPQQSCAESSNVRISRLYFEFARWSRIKLRGLRSLRIFKLPSCSARPFML